MKLNSLIVFLVSVGLSIIMASPTRAQTTYVWTNETYYLASGSWASPQTWSPNGPANGTDNIADLSQVALHGNPDPSIVTLDGTFSIGTIHFGDQNSGHPWVINTGSGGPLTLSVSSGTPTIKVDNSQIVTINAVLAGTGFTLIGGGSGTLTLGGSSANTLTGPTTVENNTLILGKPSGSKALGGDLIISGSAASGISACYVIESNNEQLVDTAVVTINTTGGGLGTWELLGNNQIIAGLNDNGHGNVEIAESSTMTTGSSTLTLNGSGSYTFGGRIREYNDLSSGGLLNIIKNGTGTQTFMGQHAPQWNGTTIVNAGRLILSSNVVNVAGILSNNATIELHTIGSFSFQSTPPPTFCGPGTLLKTGPDTIFFGYVNNPGDGGANIAMSAGGLFDIQQGSIQNYGGLGNWSNNKASLSISNGASLQMDTKNVWVDALNGAGTINQGSANGQVQSLIVGVSGGNGSFSGVIEDTGSTPLALVKVGSGTQKLSGNNSYPGGTIVSNGTLLIDSPVGSGTGSGAVTVIAGATLGGLGNIGGPVTLNGGSTLRPGDPAGTFTVNNNLTVNNSCVLQFALGTNSAQCTVNGVLTLGGTLNITDGGGFSPGIYVLFYYNGSLVNHGVSIGSTPNGSYSYTIDTGTTGQVKLDVTDGSITDPFEQWQILYFHCTGCPQAAGGADPLGKGMSNTNQFLAGLNPTNTASLFSIVSVAPSGNDIVVTWQGAGTKTNVVQATNGQPSGTYTNDYEDIASVILPAGSIVTNSYTDVGGATNSPARYYRIRLGP